MRINKFVAQATGLSRRAADTAIAEGRVTLNNQTAQPGDAVALNDSVTLDKKPLVAPVTSITIMLNKPTGYVVSRQGQGSKTVYDLLPPELHTLKPVGRLDKDSSGLLLMTTDGQLAHELSHPSRQKRKVYHITLNESLQPLHRQLIAKGIALDDGISRLSIERLQDNNDTSWIVTMHEGRNRQIRRTFHKLGYTVTGLHRTQFGSYQLQGLKPGHYQPVS